MPKPTSKEAIKKALLELMNQKQFVNITISDIINTAGIARVSFYRNYHSIADVIDEISKEMTEHFLEEIQPLFRSRDERQWREFLFHHFYEFSKQCEKNTPYKFMNGHVIFSKVNALMKEAESKNPTSSISEKYSIYAKFGIVDHVVKKWIDSGKQETPEEMIDYIMSFILLF